MDVAVTDPPFTLKVVVVELVAPKLSVTVAVAVYVPGAVKVSSAAGVEYLLPSEYCSWSAFTNPSASVDAAVQPRTVVGDMFGIAVKVMLATGGMSPGSASTVKDAVAVVLPEASSDCTEI